MNRIFVSVIVTTKNSSRTIRRCLESIRKQSYVNKEIIVVDNHSSDETLGIAHKYTDSVFVKGPERSAQRNFGVKKSRGMYLLFVDSDMYLEKKVIEQCVHKMEKKNIVALYIPEKMTGESFWVTVRNFERSFYNETAIDAVRFMKKDDFIDVGGFDETLTAGEDWDLDRKIQEKGSVTSISSCFYHDEGKATFAQLVHKKKGYASYLNTYVSKWGESDRIVKKQLGFSYRFITVFTEKGKWKKLMKHPVLTISMYFLKFHQGFAYLLKMV